MHDHVIQSTAKDLKMRNSIADETLHFAQGDVRTEAQIGIL